jgi:hypothetical protein
MRAERKDHTLQLTAVVHQLYLELVKVKALRPAGSDGADEKAAFLGLAAYLMKQLLIHHARPLSKRAEKAELPDLPGPHSSAEQSLVEIEDVLKPACGYQSGTPARSRTACLRRPDARRDRSRNGLRHGYGRPPLELRPKLARRSLGWDAST